MFLCNTQILYHEKKLLECVTTMELNWLIIYSFTSRSRIFHLYGNVTIADLELQNLGLCSALRVFEQGRVFIVPHLLWYGTSVIPGSSEGPPHLVASYMGIKKTYSNPDPHWVNGVGGDVDMRLQSPLQSCRSFLSHTHECMSWW
jgi:hypothetical protein